MASIRHFDEDVKQERIDLRTTSKIKDILTYAAELKGISMSAFMLEAAYEKAKNIIKQDNVVLLSNGERDRLLSLLEKPAKPNKKLKQAMKKYLSREE